jgi:hypothetical protein
LTETVSFLEGQDVESTIVYEPRSSLPGVTMSLIGATLLDTLRSVERPGAFWVGGIREIFMPTIDVDGVGSLGDAYGPDVIQVELPDGPQVALCLP